jgi:hypothetical protein
MWSEAERHLDMFLTPGTAGVTTWPPPEQWRGTIKLNLFPLDPRSSVTHVQVEGAYPEKESWNHTVSDGDVLTYRVSNNPVSISSFGVFPRFLL